jgi:DNA-binding response OmpR family regulator
MTTLGSVLIVEDDTALRQGLRSTLEAAGFCPGEASSGEEAAFALHHNSFETVLLDQRVSHQLPTRLFSVAILLRCIAVDVVQFQ